MGAAITNEILTRGLVTDPVPYDLSKLTLGSFRDPKNNISRLMLGDEKFAVSVELNPRGDPRSICIYGPNKEPILGVSLHGRHSWPRVCEVILRCCDLHSADDLQRYLKSRELSESLRKFDRFPQAGDVRRTARQLADCNQFVTVQLPCEAEFGRRLDALPFMSAEDFLGFAKPTQCIDGERLFRIGTIIGSDTGTGWRHSDTQSGDSYRIASSLVKNGTPWHSSAHPVRIAVFDGVGFALSGSSIPAAVKGMGNPDFTVRAESVRFAGPIRLVAESADDARIIQARINDGLFSAEVEIPGRVARGAAQDIHASWIVNSFTAPWVFSKKIDAAEQLYKQSVQAARGL